MSNALFTGVSYFATGYDKKQVEDFFDRARQAYEGRAPVPFAAADIQAASFDLVRRGYNTHEVDAALDRLEAAFVARASAEYIQVYGNDAWMTALADRARTLYPRLGRPAGARFAQPSGRQVGYDQGAVDMVCDRLVGYFDRQEPLTSKQLRATTFPKARGGKSYAEGPVDAFIARAVEVLLGVE